MAQTTTVYIGYGRLSALLEINYLWYSSGDDTWERIEGMHIIPIGGVWYQHKTTGYGKGTMSLSKKGDSSMWLYDFDRKDLGRRGKGQFHGFDAWYNIPKYADISWEIVGFD
jgi:hypothetical protein